MTANTLFLALDGLGLENVQHWRRQGLLPFFDKILDQWQVAAVTNYPGTGDSAYWRSVHTGCAPGRNGHYFPMPFNSSTYLSKEYAYHTDHRKTNFWDWFDARGKTCAVVDMAQTAVSRPSRGKQVRGWLLTDRFYAADSFPGNLISEIQSQYGDDPVTGYHDRKDLNESEKSYLAQAYLQRIDIKMDLVRDWLVDDLDLLCVGFSDIHDCSHQCWHLCESDNSDGANPIRDVLIKLDQAMSELIEISGADKVFITGGLGMQEYTSASMGLDHVLGALSGHSGTDSELEAMRPQRPYFKTLHNSMTGAIQLNLIGRESSGIIDPSDYDRTCDELIERLSGLVDDVTGEPLIKQIFKVKDVHKGPYAKEFPDIFIEWQRDRPTNRVRLDGVGVFDNVSAIPVENRSGDHNDDAFLITNQCIDTSSLIYAHDIAPTIACANDVNYMLIDGSSLLASK
ncbi:MAG: hypothetical protein AAF402_05345 [Pseudomonadota bacterium]